MSVVRLRAIGPTIFEGTTQPFRCQLDAVGKTNRAHPDVVANEFICSRLGMTLGLPVAPGTVVEVDDHDLAPGGLAYISLDAYPEGERPAPPGPELLNRVEDLCAGTVAFDAWVLCEDRHVGNVVFSPDVGVPFTVFDFDGALMANDRDVADPRYAERAYVGGALHGRVRTWALLSAWCQRISAIPVESIEMIVTQAHEIGAIEADKADSIRQFLCSQKERLAQLLAAEALARRAFPHIDEPGVI